MRHFLSQAIFVVAMGICMSAQASETAPAAFLKAHCLDCHDNDDPKGKLDLSSLSFPPTSSSDLKTWIHIFDRVEAGEMPPKKKDGSPRLALDQSQSFRVALHSGLMAYDTANQKTLGRVATRHISRFEYQRTMEQLLGIDIPLTDDLPDDLKINSYDTVTQYQAMSQYHLSQFLAAADLGLQQAVAVAADSIKPFKRTYSQKDLARKAISANDRGPIAFKDKDVIAGNLIGNFYGRVTETDVPESGWYRVSMLVQGNNIPKETDHLWGVIRSGVCYSSSPAQYFIGRFPATNKMEKVSFEAWIQGRHILEIKMQDANYKGITRGPWSDDNALKIPSIAYRDLTIERISKGQSANAVKQILFGDIPIQFDVQRVKNNSGDKYAKVKPSAVITMSVPDSVTDKDLAPLITTFASRAFRRPVTTSDCAPYIQLAKAEYQKNKSFTDALLTGYRTILVSPRFLYFEEKPGSLDAYAMANRLSYFLTAQPADNKLLEAAERNQLQTPAHIRAHAERLLATPAFNAAIDHFVDQWMMLTQIDATTPDDKIAPTYDDALKYAMMDETRDFVRHLIANNKPAKDLIAADYTIIDSRLATLYNIPWSGKPHARVIQYPKNSPRGGLMTQAAILKVTANGTSTSPVIRGVWMLERLMGVHVPLPPDNVPAIEPDTRGAKTIRDILEKHREETSCATCHSKIDPPGFALETFDVIGEYRTAYQTENKKSKLPIDASATMHDGRSFTNINQFRALLEKDQRTIARTFLEHLTTYATGATISYADRKQIDHMLDQCAPNFGLRSLILELVTNPIFMNK